MQRLKERNQGKRNTDLSLLFPSKKSSSKKRKEPEEEEEKAPKKRQRSKSPAKKKKSEKSTSKSPSKKKKKGKSLTCTFLISDDTFELAITPGKKGKLIHASPAKSPKKKEDPFAFETDDFKNLPSKWRSKDTRQWLKEVKVTVIYFYWKNKIFIGYRQTKSQNCT